MLSASAAEHFAPDQPSAVVPIDSGAADKSRSFIKRKRSKRAAQKISALGEMTGGIAHDFRNILCVITSGLNVAERNSSDAAKVESAIAAVREGVDRGMRMTNRLLAFAKDQSFDRPGDVERFTLSSARSSYGAGPGSECPDLHLTFPGLVYPSIQFAASQSRRHAGLHASEALGGLHDCGR